MSNGEHWADVTPAGRTYRVVYEGKVLVHTDDALELVEHYGDRTFPKVIYFPRETVGAIALAQTASTSHCPIKGDATWYTADGVQDGAWSYETPLDGVATIARHVAFDPAKGFAVEAV